MRNLFLLVLLSTFGLTAIAEIPVVIARQVSCEELNNTLTQYGTITVLKKVVGFSVSKQVYDSEPTCAGSQISMKGVFRTKDIRNCIAGFICVRDLHDPNCPGQMCNI